MGSALIAVWKGTASFRTFLNKDI
ncbi:hypothetical protein KUCAC02_003967 [Chaenocephalus aceratus]|uniref:Uncharacterized protein n=1 Tax=Chaenocephalus aceratus TaxID=36190 RepID=A0ACB9WYA6_CHAAC|nr:hypothetical protein KUCAC02_003967 [Chaenocephalus aceratus]